MGKRDFTRKSLSVVTVIIFLGVFSHPIVYGESINVIKDIDFVEVACQVSTPNGVEQIINKIHKEKLDEINTLAKNMSNDILSKKLSFDSIKQKITFLAVELQNVQLLPNGIDIEAISKIITLRIMLVQHFLFDSNFIIDNMEMDDNSTDKNLLCFIYGEGVDTISIKLITGIICDYLFAIYSTFGWEIFEA